jgi:hypothetical protein
MIEGHTETVHSGASDERRLHYCRLAVLRCKTPERVRKEIWAHVLAYNFAATRRRIVAFAKGTNEATTAEHAAQSCSILPSTDQADLEAAPALGRTGVKLPRGEWTLMSLGMAEYSSGHFAEADATLTTAMDAGKSNPHVAGTSAFYSAMCLFRQGKPDEARKLAIADVARMKPLPNRRTESAGQRCLLRRPDCVAGLQGSECLDQVRGSPAAEGGERQEMKPARDRTRAAATARGSDPGTHSPQTPLRFTQGRAPSAVPTLRPATSLSRTYRQSTPFDELDREVGGISRPAHLRECGECNYYHNFPNIQGKMVYTSKKTSRDRDSGAVLQPCPGSETGFAVQVSR